MAQSHKARLTPRGKAVRSWKAVDRGERTHIGDAHYKQAHNEESKSVKAAQYHTTVEGRHRGRGFNKTTHVDERRATKIKNIRQN